MSEPLLSAKELADAHGRHVNWVYEQKSLGFVMPGGRATLTEFRAWLAKNEGQRRRRPMFSGDMGQPKRGKEGEFV